MATGVDKKDEIADYFHTPTVSPPLSPFPENDAPETLYEPIKIPKPLLSGFFNSHLNSVENVSASDNLGGSMSHTFEI